MASKCSRIINRASISNIKSAINKSNLQTATSCFSKSATTSFVKPSLSSKSTPSTIRRFCVSRTPSELGAVASLLPLHSAVATARMTSCLSSSSRSCRALSQGT